MSTNPQTSEVISEVAVGEEKLAEAPSRPVGTTEDAGPLLAPLGLTFWRMKGAFEREMGVSAGTWFTLALLVEEERISQGELSQRFEIDPSRVTRLAKRLEREGLILRKRHPEDHRVVRMFLTEKGRGLVEHLHQYRVSFDRRIATMLSVGEIEELRRMLGVLAQGMKD
jgi:DNA-binding MarR family transcriptional regulator